MRTEHVIVEPYNPQWRANFEVIQREIDAAIGNLIITVEHVGSTAVPGLSAKPIIDIDIVLPDKRFLPAVVAGLAAIGYLHEGDLGVEGREAFSYTNKPHLQMHHLYVCPKNSPELHRHITFRNYLRLHPEAAAVYSRVKEEAAWLYPEEIEKYMQHKASCIEELYHQCGL